MSLTQNYDGQEHVSAGTRISMSVLLNGGGSSDIGVLPYAISITEAPAKVAYSEVKVLGSAYAVAHGQPSGDMPELTLKIRKSGLPVFLGRLRTATSIPAPQRLELAGIRLVVKQVSAHFDEANGAPLPTQTRSFTAIYCGNDGGTDRTSSEAMTCNVFLKQCTPADEDA